MAEIEQTLGPKEWDGAMGRWRLAVSRDLRVDKVVELRLPGGARADDAYWTFDARQVTIRWTGPDAPPKVTVVLLVSEVAKSGQATAEVSETSPAGLDTAREATPPRPTSKLSDQPKKTSRVVEILTNETFGRYAIPAFFGVISAVLGRLSVQLPGCGVAVVPVNVVPLKPIETLAPDKTLSEGDGFETLRDVSVWDLRAWKKVPSGNTNDRYSPVNYVNYLHVKRTRPGTGPYVAHYSTEGDAIDIRCLTHHCEQLEVKPAVAPTRHKYEVRVDNVGAGESLLVIEATYWNSFQKPHEWVVTYAENDAGKLLELVTFILLPESRKMVGYNTVFMEGEGRSEKAFLAPSTIYKDAAGHVLFWSVPKPEKGFFYKVYWDW